LSYTGELINVWHVIEMAPINSLGAKRRCLAHTFWGLLDAQQGTFNIKTCLVNLENVSVIRCLVSGNLLLRQIWDFSASASNKQKSN